MEHPACVPVRPTVRHFHNQPELQRGGSYTLILRWILILWIAGCGPLGSTVKQDGCRFPERWYGRWFQSGVIQPILIDNDRLSNKGKCLSFEGDKFLLVDDKGCYRCVVMHEKHENVLQYKETFCHHRDALPHLCSSITGDALLYSMFRENAKPVDCPLKGPFSFTYNRGHGDCKSPVSSIESCTEDSRLLLNYQACPDVHGSESTVEELECLAAWKEGSLRFLVGKLHHNHATSNEDRYRCFVYEKTNSISSASVKDGDDVEYRVAQSGDATCNGLFSATEGSRTMALKRVSVRFNCQFPSWMTFSHTWHTLDYSSNYTFYQKNATLRISNQTGVDIKVYCVNIKASSPSGNSVALVAHWQHHCASRYVCVVLYRRDDHVAELQLGQPTYRIDDACSPRHFSAATEPYVTLLAGNPGTKECPYTGKYAIQNHRNKRNTQYNERTNRKLYNFNIRNISETPLMRNKRQEDVDAGACDRDDYSRLEVGCNTPKTMEFYSNCNNKEIVTAFTCHGGWYEDGTSFVVTRALTRNSISAHRHCLLFTETNTGLTLTAAEHNCVRGNADKDILHAKLTHGECQDATNSQTTLRITPAILAVTSFAALHNIVQR